MAHKILKCSHTNMQLERNPTLRVGHACEVIRTATSVFRCCRLSIDERKFIADALAELRNTGMYDETTVAQLAEQIYTKRPRFRD